MPKTLVQAKDCAAKASLISIISISFNVNPAFFKAFCVAVTGPIPMIRGSTPTIAEATILAFGLKPYKLMADSEAKNMAAEPSFKPAAFPAVTLPPSFLKAGFKVANFSSVEWGFTNSSVSKSLVSPFFTVISTPTISSANRPDCWAL